MSFSEKSLVRVTQAARGNTSGATTGGNMNSLFLYATDDAFATVATAGYFNNARGNLTVGDQILVSAASNKGGLYTVTAVPASGNVTVTASVLA